MAIWLNRFWVENPSIFARGLLPKADDVMARRLDLGGFQERDSDRLRTILCAA